jgi:hypothetical protein
VLRILAAIYSYVIAASAISCILLDTYRYGENRLSDQGYLCACIIRDVLRAMEWKYHLRTVTLSLYIEKNCLYPKQHAGTRIHMPTWLQVS